MLINGTEVRKIFFDILIEFNVSVDPETTSVAPLHIATKMGLSEFIPLLIEKGAPINKVDPSTGQTALQISVQDRLHSITKMYLKMIC